MAVWDSLKKSLLASVLAEWTEEKQLLEEEDEEEEE